MQRAFDAAARLLGEPGALLPSQSQQHEPGLDPNAAAVVEAQKRVLDLFGERVLRSPPAPAASPVVAELQAYHRKSPCDFFALAAKDANAGRICGYPRVAKLASRFLCVPATSVPERVFSKAGWIVNKRRYSPSDNNVSTLCFLTCNAKNLAE